MNVSDFISDYGGYAGIASILGLAVLSLLYFAQAREVKRLREWAGRAPERAAELEQRVAADATRRTITPMPQRTPPPRPGQPQTAAAQGGAVKPAPGNGQAPGTPATAPAAAGAAAAAAAPGAAKPATPAAPGSGDAAPDGAAAPGVPAAGAAAAGTPAAAAGAPSASTAAPAATPGADDGDGAPSGAPASADASRTPTSPGVPGGAVAAGAAGAAGARPGGPARPGSPTPPPGPRTAAARPRPAAPSQALRTTSPSATVPPRGPGRSDRPRHTLGILAGLLGVITLGLVLFFVLSGDDGGERAGDVPPTVETVPPPATTQREDTARTARGDVKVAVFNATEVAGLAKTVADKIVESGWARDEVSNAPPPSKSATIVHYAEGAKAQATDVAEVIGVGSDGVQPMDQNVRALDDDARVIVIVGADQQQG